MNVSKRAFKEERFFEFIAYFIYDGCFLAILNVTSYNQLFCGIVESHINTYTVICII